MKSTEIRKAFLTYFQNLNHTVVPSSSLVPANDPTLLFTNAGMVQFKDVFLGLESRPYTRAVSIQKCLRAGGKHNDLENVGYTARHHTFFEMLGFFSFGDYFKREAIQYAWTFLTEIMKLPKEKLWISVYKEDDEAAKIWLEEIGVPKDRFSYCGEESNFWSMGETGPCGPCTEIFYDHGPEIAGGPPGSPDEDGDRYIEVWNLVFMQFNRDHTGKLHPLPKVAVDTGMGLERLAAIKQGVHSNYEIDEFQALIQALLKLTPQTKPGNPSLRVIADHMRASAFLIAEGVLPANEGRGYVLRRIIRRAIRHANQLGIASFTAILPTLVSVMGEDYPELKAQQTKIEAALKQEEHQFSETLNQGLKLLQETIRGLESKQISGEVAFKLYDTYGFPLDLTEDILREQGLTVDRTGFEVCMDKQRSLSQARSTFTTATPLLLEEEMPSLFCGYEKEALSTTIQSLFVSGEKTEQLKAGEKAVIILKATPFYAESGGQVGDQGTLKTKQACFEVTDTKSAGQVILHEGTLISGALSVGEAVEAQVDAVRRQAIRLNHTATHLLHAALKKVLGERVEQKGSLVEDKRARFDFSYPQAMTAAQLNEVENIVNAQIRENKEAVTQVMSLEEAKKTGAVALFGEKYADKVRVLAIGDFSKELCGGTHASRAGDIGLFKITSEYGVASGVRRIEMVTGAYAVEWVNNQLSGLDDIASLFKVGRNEVKDKVLQFTNDIKEKDKQLAQMKLDLAKYLGLALVSQVETVNGMRVLIALVEGVDMQGLRATLDVVRSKVEKAVIVLYSTQLERMNVVVAVSQSLLGQVPKAAELAKTLCGQAGGRDDMAQGGGPLPADLAKRIEALKQQITERQ